MAESDATQENGNSALIQGLGWSPFFTVRVADFDGPIDLLLHLVKQRELPIESLSLARVTAQYLECLEQLKEVDLDLAAEYLVIAATLVSIKASYLLDEPLEMEIGLDDGELSPHQELLNRLREAQVYREGASTLASRKILGVDVFSKISTVSQFAPPPESFKMHDAMLLGEAFRKMLSRSGDADLMKITVDSVTVVERMIAVIDRLKESGGVASFEELIPDATSRYSLITSFIAMLELCKRGAIQVHQGESYGSIAIALTEIEIDLANIDSEFDIPLRAVNEGSD